MMSVFIMQGPVGLKVCFILSYNDFYYICLEFVMLSSVFWVML